jgi:Icc protein
MKRIAYITDVHMEEQFPKDFGVDARRNLKLILEDVRKRDISEIIIGGDMGETTAMEFFELLKDFTLHATLGNHDDFTDVAKYYTKYILEGRNELYYSFEEGAFRYIFLDSSSGQLGQAQLQWLEDELKTDRGVLLFLHHPILPVNTGIDKLYPLRNRDSVRSLLQDFPQPITIFCGHYHIDDETTIGHIRQFITPAASVQIRKESDTLELYNGPFGYRIINIDGDSVSTELVLYKDEKFL